MILAIAILLPMFAGAGILALVHPRRRSFPEWIALSFLLGQFSLAGTFFFVSILAVESTVPVTAGILLCLGITGLAVRGWKGRSGERAAAIMPRSVPAWIFAGFTGLMIIAVTLQSMGRPICAYDAWAIYASKAHCMQQRGEFDSAVMDLELPHPDYPLLIPIGETWLAMIYGHWNEWVAKLFVPLYLLAAAALVLASVRRYSGSDPAWFAAMLFCTTPHLFLWAPCATCDFPLAVMLLAAAAVMLEYVNSRSTADLWLMGCLLGGASWIKNEGLPLAAILLIALTARQLFRRTGSLRGLTVPWSILIISALPWWIYKAFHGLTNEMINSRSVDPENFVNNLSRLPDILHYMRFEMFGTAQQVVPWGNWSVAWIAFFAALAFRLLGPRRRHGFLAAAVLMQLLLVVTVFWITPYSLQYQLRTALDRLLLQIFPAAFLFTMLTLLPAIRPSLDPNDGEC